MERTAGEIRKLIRELRHTPSRSKRKLLDNSADAMEELLQERETRVDMAAFYAGMCDQLKESLTEAIDALKHARKDITDDGK